MQETGGDRVDKILGAASALGVSLICPPEVISALCRRRREKSLSARQYAAVKNALAEDIADAEVIQLTDRVIARAVELLEAWPLRSADALHLACAVEWRADWFVSADERQCTAAHGCGLHVERLTAE